MLSSLLLVVALGQAAPPQAPAPPETADAPSAVRVLFQAGDLRRAVSMCRACAGSKKKGAKECLLMLEPLVEFQALMNRGEALTAAEARALFEYERKVSPEVQSKLSSGPRRRFVEAPFEGARAAAAQNPERARQLAEQVLAVDPSHAGALALLGRQAPDAGRESAQRGGPDAGAAKRAPRGEPDAGVAKRAPARERDGGR